ncbi:MAG TPA: UDP-N-acetylenolpyruvoylglucosamine reductase, partial [Acidimicrobiaceae bacterium]|nr:UDP-N-acetylenolpyruvoylglucosamine reductase [Acidimicrobiaceae bacterium]
GKGLRIGSAVVSERHANFIQADSGGSAIDVLLVMTEVQRLVAEAHGIELTPETVLVGFNGGRG